jgi:hypothetical protein
MRLTEVVVQGERRGKSALRVPHGEEEKREEREA